MKISCIFADVLYSFVIKNKKNYTEWDDAYKKLTSLEFLENFFEQHQADLMNGFYKGKVNNITDAVILTRKMATTFFSKVYNHCECGDNLDCLFKNLDNKFPAFSSLALSKLQNKKDLCDWLRIYGIRIDNGVYSISGGTIKLTEYMTERSHTEHEFSKMKRFKENLKNESIFNADSLFDFIENT